MFIKQIDVNEALRLFAAGQKVLVMAPTVPEPQKWTDYTPDILQDMLSDCLFFRKEPAIVNQDFEDAFQDPPTLRELIQNLPEAPQNRPPDLWVPVAKGKM